MRLSTAKLDALVTHEAGDLICVAQAGMRLADLQAALALDAEHRQRLMLDPPHGDAQTLGGIVAANASGPLRTRYGAPRDLVIGARFVLSDGTVTRTGGRVVKNVAGYDLAKLLCGSLGTLAVVTEVAFRLHPLADAARTVALDDATPEAVAAFAQALATAPVVPAACEAVWPDGALLVRVESSEDGAERQAALAAGLAPGARARGRRGGCSLGRARTRPWGGDGVVAAIGVPPARLGDLLALADGHGAEPSCARTSASASAPGRLPRAGARAASGRRGARRARRAAPLDPRHRRAGVARPRSRRRGAHARGEAASTPPGTLAPGRHAHEAAA